ncbi:hypothetical protein E2C01_015920 [Portunus trituberculatus]|uniref:Uncharacterized protein n=1 Tax=Portunus trituberculatus TaxID=210409 RepID=A0A5B7DPL2_PORTR|nr:hypothetical protein [Portunus trituberculatus]
MPRGSSESNTESVESQRQRYSSRVWNECECGYVRQDKVVMAGISCYHPSSSIIPPSTHTGIMSIAKLDLSVALKLAFVEDSLAKVEQYRHQLQKNARKECSSPGSALCEIENAHDLINDKSRWLSSRTPEQPNEEKLDVSSACMANETCQSFKDCLCQNKCRENALEKLQQTADFKAKTSRKRTFSEAEGIQAVLTHMVKILSSENSQWLLKKHGGELPRPPKCVMYNSPGDTWLRQCSDSPTKTFPRAHLSSHCNTWLLKHLKNQKNAQEKDEKEKEKYTDEKDNRITSEALSEALKRVCIDPAKRKCLGDESNLYSCSASLTFSDQPWLLARKCDTNKLTSKDQWQEKDKTCKPQWLSSSRDLSPGKEASIIGLPISLQGLE